MPLTRYLYMLDEVIYTLIENLLKKQDLRECYYWIAEIYYSGFYKRTQKLLWALYYDFYAIQYPKLENLLKEILSTKTISAYMKVVKLLFESDIDCEVYVSRMFPGPIGSLRGRVPSFIRDVECKYKKLVLLRHRKRFGEMAFLMRTFPVDEIVSVFSVNFKINPAYENVYHQLLVCLMRGTTDKTVKEVQVSKEDIQWIREINKPNDSIWRTLRDKRLYAISTTIGAFALSRFDARYPPMKRLLGFHWDYFASFSPLWKKRFKKYHAERNRDDYSMEFENDDYYEDFSEKFYYEPDEQSAETQDKSIREIKKITGTEWIKHMFDRDMALLDLGCYV